MVGSVTKERTCVHCGVPYESNARYRKFCSDCVGLGTKEGLKWRQSIHLYGVDKVMYEAMYFEQSGLCLICDEREAVVLDHCHKTGRPRGLLCRGCNTQIGFIESPAKFEKALDYISEGAY